MVLIFSQALMNDIDALHPEVYQVIDIGNRLHFDIGGDRPELEKYMEDVTNQWQGIYDQCYSRLQLLNNSLAEATNFHEQLMVRLYSLYKDEFYSSFDVAV